MSDENSTGASELTKEDSPEPNELDSSDTKGDDTVPNDQGEGTSEENVDEKALDKEEVKSTQDLPEEHSEEDKLMEVPGNNDLPKVKNEMVDDFYDKLSVSSPEPGELPDDDDGMRIRSKEIKPEPHNDSGTEDKCTTPDIDASLKIKTESDKTDKIKRESHSLENSWEEDSKNPEAVTGSPEYYSDIGEDVPSPPKTPEPKPVDKFELEPPAKKLASIFEKKVKKEDGGSSDGILQEKLKQYFGHSEFKSTLQKEAIQTIITSKYSVCITIHH